MGPPVLRHGKHQSREEGTCLMELVAYLAGEEHSDSPTCTSPSLAAGARYANDTLNDQERQQLAAIAPELIGTNCPRCEARRASAMVLTVLRKHTPLALRHLRLRDEARMLEQQPRRIREIREAMDDTGSGKPGRFRKNPRETRAVRSILQAARTTWEDHVHDQAAVLAVEAAHKARSRQSPVLQAAALLDLLRAGVQACPHQAEAA